MNNSTTLLDPYLARLAAWREQRYQAAGSILPP